jgi:hypothetical protein
MLASKPESLRFERIEIGFTLRMKPNVQTLRNQKSLLAFTKKSLRKVPSKSPFEKSLRKVPSQSPFGGRAHAPHRHRPRHRAASGVAGWRTRPPPPSALARPAPNRTSNRQRAPPPEQRIYIHKSLTSGKGFHLAFAVSLRKVLSTKLNVDCSDRRTTKCFLCSRYAAYLVNR